MEDSIQVEIQLGDFFQKSGHFFSIFKKGEGRPPPSCAPVYVCMYVYILSRTSDFVNGEKSICMKDVIMCTN